MLYCSIFFNNFIYLKNEYNYFFNNKMQFICVIKLINLLIYSFLIKLYYDNNINDKWNLINFYIFYNSIIKNN